MVNVMASSISSQNSTFSTIITQKDEEGRYSAKEERPSFSVRTARFKQMKPSRFSTWKSSKISIPLGLKPSDLLDSPILRPPIDQQAEASPTTGTSPLPPIIDGNISKVKSPSDSLDKTTLQEGVQLIIYKPIPSFGINGFSSLSTREDTMAVTKTSTSVSSPDLAPQIRMASENAHQASDNVKQDQLVMQTCRTLNLEISSEDGYSWRKYGQKLVKNSKFPRSYFRCAYPSCPVKKMVEESKVVIRGEHNHPPKPQLIRKLPTGALQSVSRNSKEGSIALASRVDSSLDHIIDASFKRDKGPKLPSELTHISEPSSASSIIEGRAGTEWTKVHEREALTRGKLGNDKDGPKSRKKVKVGETASKLSLRTFHEPRHVERIKCYSDVVDDGYRWCKYGQKAIKGNPHPRSYYKCHSPGCPVRKHVERSATDEVTVISTYEGQHNHEAPTSRLSSSAISGSFITAITLPHISSSSRSIPKSSQLPLQDHAGEKSLENDNLNKDSEPVMSVIPFLTVTNSAATNSAVTDAQPLSMCLAYPEREVMGPSMTKMATLQLLTSGSDGKSAFQRAELSRQSETFIMKSEPDDGEELPNTK